MNVTMCTSLSFSQKLDLSQNYYKELPDHAFINMSKMQLIGQASTCIRTYEQFIYRIIAVLQ